MLGEHGRRIQHDRRRELGRAGHGFDDDLAAVRLPDEDRRDDAARTHPRRERVRELGERAIPRSLRSLGMTLASVSTVRLPPKPGRSSALTAIVSPSARIVGSR